MKNRANLPIIYTLLVFICLIITAGGCNSSGSGSGGSGGSGETAVYYQDSDGDGYGNPSVSVEETSPPDGYVTNNGDCSDTAADINPDEEEICDGIDNDCDGQIDEGCDTYYIDADGDGYGDPNASSTSTTSRPAGYVSNDEDCDDTNADINPGAAEVCDGIDNNCDDLVDDTCLKVPEDYLTIQAAIDAAMSNGIIFVNDGTYYENIDYKGKAVTLLSINGAANTIIDGGGNGTVVIFGAGESSGAVLDGFTITNGNTVFAGGIYISGSSPIIKNCIITNNTAASEGGGGIYCINSSYPAIMDCTISNNTANTFGAGIYIKDSSPTITGCTIDSNANNGYDGGGIYCEASSPTISDTAITNNSTLWYGGGICAYYNSSPLITNCEISNNTADLGGGIYCLDNSSYTLVDSKITGNTAFTLGGGLRINWSSPNITNTIITNNTSFSGGAVAAYASSPAFLNCTIADNSATDDGGGIYNDSSDLTITNCILWGDTAAGSTNEVSLLWDGTVDLTYSDIDGGWTATGNINADPLFVGGGDYHLSAGSPCIDTGTASGAPSDDIDGDSRPNGNGIDMGADEHY